MTLDCACLSVPAATTAGGAQGDTLILFSTHLKDSSSTEQICTTRRATVLGTMSDYASAVLGAALLAGEQPLARLCKRSMAMRERIKQL